MAQPFEILEHPADIGFRAYGVTFEQLFENAALALFSLTCDPANVKETESREIEASGSDKELLIYAWLAELLATAEAERLVFRRAEVTALSANRVAGRAFGERFDRQRHSMHTHIKAVTFHQLFVESTAAGWRAQVFVDL
jgi:SHS2 domain-containing protein